MEAELTVDEGGSTIEGLAHVDWEAPWLAEWRGVAMPLLQMLAERGDWRAGLNALAGERGLRNHRGLPLRFVPQEVLPLGMAYESFIDASGQVPTRANLHDFFNAMAWLAYPQIKKRLNGLQAAEIAQAGQSAQGMRGKVRDAATLFDENAALFLCAEPDLAAAMRAHRWHALFVERRAAFGRACRVRLFGHALLEKLVNPYKAITAHVWTVSVEPEFFTLPENEQRDRVDALVCKGLSAELTSADFSPLPVAGVPGWWPVQDAAFYADQAVFRPQRRRADSGRKPLSSIFQRN